VEELRYSWRISCGAATTYSLAALCADLDSRYVVLGLIVGRVLMLLEGRDATRWIRIRLCCLLLCGSADDRTCGRAPLASGSTGRVLPGGFSVTQAAMRNSRGLSP